VSVSLQGITKRFGGFAALDNVSVAVDPGTIHAIVGENGAGKTTLMRILYGALQPDSGSIEIDGKAVSFGSAAEAIAGGIGMVSQHYAIIPELNCLQNLILGAEGGPVIVVGAAKVRASALASKMGFEFDWDAEASTLSPAGAQKLEILKLLWRDAKIMILDEPTAMLSPADRDALYASLRQLAADGATIIVVTHRLPEVMEFAQAVSVLRAGKLVAAKPVSQTTDDELAALIVGEQLSASPHLAAQRGASMLALDGVSVLGDRKQVALKEASLELFAGEVVGVAGVDGSGQRELVHAISGTAKLTAGRILFEGRPSPATVRERIDLGIRSIPEDRHAEGVVEIWSLEENAALGLQWRALFASGPWIDAEARRSQAASFASRFGTKHTSLSQPIGSLSGGNQQRFVAGRALGSGGKLILAFQPTRGLDLRGKQEVYDAIRAETRGGAAALVVSFDLDELLENCDRIVVLCNGVLTEPEPHEAKDRAAIGRLMVGA